MKAIVAVAGAFSLMIVAGAAHAAGRTIVINSIEL